jgi:glycosyltransferase involved in cell wall biosynthesis
MEHQLTIVIPCKNEGLGIIKTIDLIKYLNCRIIIADSSDDNITRIHLHRYIKKNKINAIVINGGLPAIARNKGAELVETPFILFLDADINILDSKVIKEALSKISSFHLDLVTCKFRSIDGRYNWVWWIFDIIQWFCSKTTPFAVGGFMLFRTKTFNELGKFNEKDKIAEDYHLSSKIKPNKFRIINNFVYTSNRRFDKSGVWTMIKIAVGAWFNRKNDKWFENDFNYWK